MTNDGSLVHSTIFPRRSGTKSEPCASASEVGLPEQVEELLK